MQDAYNIGCIDIGSNAMRASIAHMDKKNELTIFKNYRYPLRLGEDVFSKGNLSTKKIKMTEAAILHAIEKFAKHNVNKVKVCATSALRNSSNAAALINKVREKIGLEIELISGIREAHLIHKAVSQVVDFRYKTGLLIDIGGGSTELTLVKGSRILASKSFPLGTVRLLKLKDTDKIENMILRFSDQMKRFIKMHTRNQKINICVGTGGNLRRIGKLRTLLLEKPSSIVTIKDIISLYLIVREHSIKDRIKKFDMDKNRADVIIPAMAIIEMLMIENNISEIELPRIGLKEGILLDLLKYKPTKLHLPYKGT
jgi:exopolyphosphatase/guanosine-5'-triphosphate,3'-diphosphate pyrophosphatase